MQSGSNIVHFPNERRRDEAIVDLYRRRLAFERRARAGVFTDQELVEGHVKLTDEMFAIAEKFDL